MLKKLSNNKKRKLQLLLQKASIAFSLNDLHTCKLYCDRANSLQDPNPAILNLKGGIACKETHFKYAEKCFLEAIKFAPSCSDYHENLARLYGFTKKYQKSFTAYQQAIACDPASLSATLGCSQASIELQQFEVVIKMLDPWLIKQPNNQSILLLLSIAYIRNEQVEDGRNSLQLLLRNAPQHAEANRQYGILLASEGKLSDAEYYFRLAILSMPQHVLPYSNLVEIKKYTEYDDPDIQQLKLLSDIKTMALEHKIVLYQSLGKIYDDLNDNQRAFGYFHQANQLQQRITTFNLGEEKSVFVSLKKWQPPTIFIDKNLEEYSIMPIFIAGMPRSGSTLIEQILSAHHDVSSRGECNILEYILGSKLQQKTCLQLVQTFPHTSHDQWLHLGKCYIDGLCKNKKFKHGSVIDKSLNNIPFIGAIHCMLPTAKIIHIQRHPLDTCLSIYKHNFANIRFNFGNSLESLAEYYFLYQDLMAHWHNVLPKGTILEVNYEDIVCKQEAETRRILEFCNLDWDDSCLDFHKNKNRVQTASVAQVRRPIYKDSMAAWKRYEKHLQPLIDILGTKGWDATH